MADIVISVGSLRWRCMLARRRLQFDLPGGVGIFEDLTMVEMVRADIQPISEATYYEGEQIDTPVSHRITMRWVNYLDNSYVVTRETILPDESRRQELYRIRRIKELNGRKRFVSILAEQERFTVDAPVL